MTLIALKCDNCKANLKEIGNYFHCDHCGRNYIKGIDDQGKERLYETVVKKTIEVGKMAPKSASIHVEKIEVKSIILDKNLHNDILQDGTVLTQYEAETNIKEYLEQKNWAAAQTLIDNWKLEHNNKAESTWYSMMVISKASNWRELVEKRFSNFTENDRITVDKIIQNAAPTFAMKVLKTLMTRCNSNDDSYFRAVSTALPYMLNKDNHLFSDNDTDQMISQAFETAISSRSFYKTFDYLITHALRSDEIDRYINYSLRFAQTSLPDKALKYLEGVLEVDPGNTNAHRTLITDKIALGRNTEEILDNIDELLKYSTNNDDDVKYFINTISSGGFTNSNMSNVFWGLLERYQGMPEALRNEILAYGKVLLRHEQWKEATRYFEYLIALDRSDAEAYFGLFLMSIRASDEAAAAASKASIAGNRYYEKSKALYHSKDGMSARYEQIKGLTVRQKKKTTIKKGLVTFCIAAAVIVALVIVLGIVSNNRKYSSDNIVLTPLRKVDCNTKSYYFNGPKLAYLIQIENKSSLDIQQIIGTYEFYNEYGGFLASFDNTINGYLKSGDTYTLTTTFDNYMEDGFAELYYQDYELTEIRYRLKSVKYSDNKVKTYDEGQKVIKAANKDYVADNIYDSYYASHDDTGYGDTSYEDGSYEGESYDDTNSKYAYYGTEESVVEGADERHVENIDEVVSADGNISETTGEKQTFSMEATTDSSNRVMLGIRVQQIDSYGDYETKQKLLDKYGAFQGLYVESIEPGGYAARHGELQKGDIIVTANYVTQIRTIDDLQKELNNGDDRIFLNVMRDKSTVSMTIPLTDDYYDQRDGESIGLMDTEAEETAGDEVSENELDWVIPGLEKGYILQYSDDFNLDESDLSGMSKEQCRYAINEIYARHGRRFKSEELQSYFDSCSWYDGTIEPEDFDESVLSDTERYNIDFIKKYMERL